MLGGGVLQGFGGVFSGVVHLLDYALIAILSYYQQSVTLSVTQRNGGMRADDVLMLRKLKAQNVQEFSSGSRMKEALRLINDYDRIGSLYKFFWTVT